MNQIQLKRTLKSQRQLRIGEQIKQLISEVITLGDFRSSELRSGLITVIEASISPDLKNARVFVISQNKKNIAKYLNEERFIFQNQIAKKLKLRHVPKITFQLDKTFDYADKIEKLLKDPKVIKDL